MILLEEPRFTVAGHCSKKSYRGLFCCLEVSSIRAESMSMQRSGTFIHGQW